MPPGQLSAIQVHEVSEYIHFLRGVLGAVILLFLLGMIPSSVSCVLVYFWVLMS